MNTYDISQWKRCETLAEEMELTINLKRGVEFIDKKESSLGTFESVAECFAFLSGYERYVKLKKLFDRILLDSETEETTTLSLLLEHFNMPCVIQTEEDVEKHKKVRQKTRTFFNTLNREKA